MGIGLFLLGNRFRLSTSLLSAWSAPHRVWYYNFQYISYVLKPCFILDDPPASDSMRCVPEKWCVPSKSVPVKIWDDTGAAGGRPGSIWLINSMDMIAVTTGHESPKDTFYEISSTRFFIDSTQLPADALE